MENIAHVNRAALGTKRGPRSIDLILITWCIYFYTGPSSNEELCDDKSKKGKIEVDQPSVGKVRAHVDILYMPYPWQPLLNPLAKKRVAMVT